MTSIGIDIGSYSIKIAEIASSGKGYSLKRFEVFPLSIDPNKDHEIEIIDILRSFASKYEPGTTKFVLGLDQKNVTVRRRVFPFKERHKILKSLPFELEDDIPFSQTDSIFDAKVTRYVGGQSNIIAIACHKESISKYVQLSSDCLLDLDILSVKSLALSNLFENWSDAPPTIEEKDFDEVISKPVDILLNIGHKTTHLIVMKEGQLLEVRAFDWGGHSIATALAKKSSTHFTEAVRELEHKSFVLLNNEDASADQASFSDVIKEEIDSFSHLLNLTLLEIRSTYKVNFVKGLVTGGVSQLKNLAPYLTQKTEIPFKRFNVFKWNPPHDVQVDEKIGYSASVAIGLAIEGLKKPKNPALNLLRLEFAQQSQSLQLFLTKWSYTLKLLVAAFIFFNAYTMVRESYAEDMFYKADEGLRHLAKQILPATKRRHHTSISKIKAYIKEQKRYERNKVTMEKLQNINSALDLLNKLSKKLPGKKAITLNLKSFSVQNSSVQIAGEVARSADIAKIKTALKPIGLGGKVEVAATNLKAQNGWTAFAFKFDVNRYSGGE